MINNRFNLLLFVLLLIPIKLQAQHFEKADSLQKGAYGAAAWGDFDNDGRKDIAYITQANTQHDSDIFTIYKNTPGGFIAVASFPMLHTPALVWGDLNNDGFQDLIASGLNLNSGEPELNIYISHGDGTFDVIDTLPGLSTGSIAIADFDGNGFQDFVVSGYNSVFNNQVLLFKNEGNLNFTSVNQSFEALPAGEIKWCDFNNDGLPDLSLTGDGTFSRTYLYKNIGSGQFILTNNYFFGGRGTIDWIDFNNDGWDDLFVSGVDSTSAANYTIIYFNNGDETFTETQTNFPVFGEPSAADVADFDQDGIPDVFIAGVNELFLEHFSTLAITNTDSSFVLSQPIHADIMNCIVEAVDFDNDGDMDLLVSNIIWRNEGNPLGLENAKQELVQVYPNPAGMYLMVTAPAGESVVRLLDATGKQVLRSVMTEGVNTIQTAQLMQGQYQVVIIHEQFIRTEKVTIVHE